LITLERLLTLLDHALSLNGRGLAFTRESALLGSVPELDSMAVVTVLTALEEQYGFAADDDEINASTFATVGSLLDFVQSKTRA
jgi:acyl carrier protein